MEASGYISFPSFNLGTHTLKLCLVSHGKRSLKVVTPKLELGSEKINFVIFIAKD